ncbi:MAG: hypothetical protein NT105_02615 [Verrucomicrobia bacterium]|nr:hypothetical protein [Verrucomicrobiota bacterium]
MIPPIDTSFGTEILILMGLVALVSGGWVIGNPETRSVIRWSRLSQEELAKANRRYGKRLIALGLCFLVGAMSRLPFILVFSWTAAGLFLYEIWHGLRHGFIPIHRKDRSYYVADRQTAPFHFWFNIILLAILVPILLGWGYYSLHDIPQAEVSKAKHPTETKPLP